MSMMYVLLPLIMLVILLALGALFWLSKASLSQKHGEQHQDTANKATDDDSPSNPPA
ncbi:hypothetical protein JYB87_08935 [Shewanella avicenniae]|uniref:Tumour necrosis factor receptor superfamily member 19 n=1 Tax=Shewanella avicenniae TaxID=2814294 RepID=A0ABX7QUV8_9GAMM|nr:hypothetical protein [Shewanella avicenniae]QSX35296.1 hypothetical protein JYB87_08935 [Shewanella avicenniae]